MKPSVFFGFSFLHHGPHTAFRGLAAALSDQRVIDITPDILARVPARIARPLLWRWLEWNEWRLYPYFHEGGRVIHYFFPENTLRRGHRWKRDNRLLVTLHQPPDRMELMMRDPHYDRLTEGIRAADGIVVQSDSHREPFRTLFPGIPVHYIPLGVAAGHYRRRLPLRRPADGRRASSPSETGCAITRCGRKPFGCCTNAIPASNSAWSPIRESWKRRGPSWAPTRPGSITCAA